MPPPKKSELRARTQHTYDMIDGTVTTVRNTSDLIIENGMWLALSVDVFMVTGRICPEDRIFWQQRDGLVKTLSVLTDDKWEFELPILPDLGIPNPMAAFTGLLKPFVDLLKERHPDKPPPDPLTTEETIEWGLPEFPITPGGAWKEAWETIEKMAEVEEGKMGWKPGCYKALPIGARVFLALVVPGILRYLMSLGSNVAGIAKKLI